MYSITLTAYTRECIHGPIIKVKSLHRTLDSQLSDLGFIC